jgi:hypothetical protein
VTAVGSPHPPWQRLLFSSRGFFYRGRRTPSNYALCQLPEPLRLGERYRSRGGGARSG